MEDTRLVQVVHAVRPVHALGIVLVLIVIYWVGIRPWMANWGSTAAEQQMVLPGDELIPAGSDRSTLALTINAPPEVVWQWLVQIGQDRAGFYSYTWLENLVGADIHNTDEIRPEWQDLAVGDAWRLVPPDYLGGVGRTAFSKVLSVDPGRSLVVEMFGSHVIQPVDEHSSRLIVRGQAPAADLMTTMLIAPMVFTMERRMLLGLKARAEGRPEAPMPLLATAHLGWMAAGLVVAALFLGDRRRRRWIVLPILAAVPAIIMGHDAQAALAAFLAVGITLLGFLIFGRSWWGPILVIGSVVMLTLLLASDAYIVIGVAFALMLVATAAAKYTRNIGGAHANRPA